MRLIKNQMRPRGIEILLLGLGSSYGHPIGIFPQSLYGLVIKVTKKAIPNHKKREGWSDEGE